MRFIGCKENLLDFIEAFIKEKDIKGSVFCDLFSGTASVAKHFKKLGYKVISTDLLYFSYVLQKVYIEQNQYPEFLKLLECLKISSNEETLFTSQSQNAKEIIKYLNDLEGQEGFIYQNYSPEGTKDKTCVRKYFTGENAKRIDTIREKIGEWQRKKILNEQEYFFLLAALIEAVPFVANISGTYAAFLKDWDKRAFKTLTLEVPEIIQSNETHNVFNLNGLDLLDKIKKIDILYLDPPYNDDKQNFETLLDFCKKHQIDEWRLIEKMSVLPFTRQDIYLEEYANKIGLKVVNQLPGHKLTLLHTNVPITLYRCHCVAIWLNKKYIPESLFLDPEGQVLLCMHNNMKINLLDSIKKRKTSTIIKLIKDINFKTICPALKLK